MEYFHWSAWLAGCLCSLPAPAHSSEYEKLEKVFDFIVTSENVSLNILLLLNPKHSSYWEENYPYPR